MKGISEFVDTNGVKRGFKLGTYAFAIACKADGCSLDILLRRIGIAYTDEHGNEKKDPVNLESLLNVFYGAAVHYSQNNNVKVDFNASHVSDWIDHLGIEKANEILSDGLNQYVPKNYASLAETGEATV